SIQIIGAARQKVEQLVKRQSYSMAIFVDGTTDVRRLSPDSGLDFIANCACHCNFAFLPTLNPLEMSGYYLCVKPVNIFVNPTARRN
ncbi:hypothetical protein OCK02_25430, partial [Rhizobium sp. TRM96647]|uniref:hypothetical protein n=1 Tax=unclassified Rhizobium TaxID=2613769 RepID=UPI0021E90BC4